MSIICPTITATNITDYDRQLKLVASFSNRVHIDLMDGTLAPTKTPNINDIYLAKGIINDIHLMYQNPAEIIDQVVKLNPNLVILHPESDADIPYLATTLREADIKTGIALLPETTVESVERLLPHIQHALIFSGHLGYHGGSADLKLLEKATQIKRAARHLEIAWDGGANISNISQMKDAGIDVVNVGGAIHNATDPQAEYEKLNIAAR